MIHSSYCEKTTAFCSRTKANYSRLSRHNNETQSQAQPICPPPTARKIPSKPNKKPTRHRTPIPPQHRARDATLKRKRGQKPTKRRHPHPPNPRLRNGTPQKPPGALRPARVRPPAPPHLSVTPLDRRLPLKGQTN